MAIMPGPNEEYPFKVQCTRSENCFFSILTKSLAEAQKWDDPKQHKCPRGVDTIYGASMTESLLEKSWALLDSHTGMVMALSKEHPERPVWQARARGVAEVIALFMPPHFRTADEVVREALKRYRAAQEGEEHSTPGLGALKYTFPNDEKYKRPVAQAAALRAQADQGKQPVDEKTKADILFMRGMATPQMIAETYGISVATVERVLADAS